MADNTQINVGIGGDIIRTKSIAGIKTEIVQLDLGGETAEQLITAGQKTMANSVPVVMASDYVQPVSVADGSDVAEGATTDSAITTDSSGTISGKLRGLVKIFSSVWDSINGRLLTSAKMFGTNSSTGATEAIWKDPFTGAVVNIDIPHEAIHIGKYFSYSAKIAIANTASYDHLLVIPSAGGKFIHLRLFLISGDSTPLDLILYEGTTVTANGTLQTGYNFNRNFSNSTLSVYTSPTVTTTGTQINIAMIIGSKQNGGVGESSGTEWVLLPSTNYLVRITNNSGGASNVSVRVEWYELP